MNSIIFRFDQKKISHIPSSGGVYMIFCVFNEKFYIGGTKNFHNRITSHKTKLKNNKHTNRPLQNAWNTYGEKYFLFIILKEERNIDTIFKKEQLYLNYLEPYNKSIGFNISKFTTNTRYDYKADGKRYNLLSPNGETFTGHNITKFAKEKNISVRSLIALVAGQIKFHDGWINLDKEPKKIKLLSPHNKIIEIYRHQLRKFCKNHDLNYNLILRVINGKSNFFKGWSSLRKPLKKYLLNHRDGRNFIIWSGNINTICRLEDIKSKLVYKLIKNPLKSEEGWSVTNV